MKRARKTAEERQKILEAQDRRGLSNAATAVEFGISVATLSSWRRRERSGTAAFVGSDMVEVTSLVSSSSALMVHLSNGIRLEAPLSWPLEHLGRAAKLLSCL